MKKKLIILSLLSVAAVYASSSVIQDAFVNGVRSIGQEALNNAVPDSAIKETASSIIEDSFKIKKESLESMYDSGCHFTSPEGAVTTATDEVEKETQNPQNMVTEVYKRYLKDPENLRSFYQAKKEAALLEARKMDTKEKGIFLMYMRVLHKLMTAISDDEIRTGVLEYITESDKKDKIVERQDASWEYVKGQEVFKNMPTDTICKTRDKVKENHYLFEQVDSFCKARDEYDDASQKLAGMEDELAAKISKKYVIDSCFISLDPELYKHILYGKHMMFIYRRYSEGGQELIDEYKSIILDFAASLSKPDTKKSGKTK